jgi:TonB family protein
LVLLTAVLEPAITASGAAGHGVGATQTTALRFAVVGFVNNGRPGIEQITTRLTEALATDVRVVVIDPSLIKAALAGFRYEGSINLSRVEARGIGAAIGCDFFIIGKTEALARSESEKESHGEANIGVMIVDGRSGDLAVFDFISERAVDADAAIEAAANRLVSRVGGYVNRAIDFRLARAEPKVLRPSIRRRTVEDLPVAENAPDLIEEIPVEGSAAAAGFKPPEFLNRVKPEYTEEADKADISATVEALAVFRSDGTIGDVEITRWAGFGLDEAAVHAIRQLQFKPATRNERPINVRASIRYNFRRVDEPPESSETPAADEKPKRDLRELFKPRYRPPR